MSEGTIIGRGVIPIVLDPAGAESALVGMSSRMTAKLKGIGAVGGGALALGITAGVGALVGLAKVGHTFEEMEHIIIKATGASGKALEGLNDSAKNVAKQTPASMTDVATAIGGLSARTHATGKVLEDTALSVLRLTKVTGGDLKTNIAAMTRLFGDWAIPTNRQSFALDKLLAASQNTGIGVDTLATLMTKFGSPLRQLGFDFDTTAAMFARFEREGVNMQTTLPGLRFGLKQLAKATDEMPKAQVAVIEAQKKLDDALKKGGKHSIEAQKATNQLSEAQYQLKFLSLAAGKTLPEGLAAGMKAIKQAGTAAEANTLAFKLFGGRAGPDMAAAIREGRFELGPLIKKLRESKGTLKDTAKETRTVGGAFALMRNRISVAISPLAIRVFDAISTSMISLADSTEPMINGMGKFFERFKGGKGDVGAVGDTLRQFGKTVLPEVREQFHRITATVGPAFDSISKNLHDNFVPAFQKVMPVLAPVAKFIVGIIGSAIVGAIKGAVQALNGLITVVAGVFNIIAGLVHGDWGQVWKGVKQIVTGALNFIIGAIKVWFNLGILSLFRKGALAIILHTKGLWTAIPRLFREGTAATGRLLWRGLLGLGRLFVAGVKSYLGLWRGMFRFLGDLALTGFKVLRSKFGGAFAALRTIVSTAVRAVKDIWVGYWTHLRDVGGKIIGFIRDTLPTAFRKALGAIGRMWGRLSDAALTPVRFIVNTVYTEGIRRVVNAIPGIPGSLQPIKMRKGGPVPVWGQRGKDSVRAMLMPDEHVWTTDEVKGAGGHYAVKRLRELARRKRLGRSGDTGWDLAPGFAKGGAVPIGNIMGALAWAQKQVGKPYIWGATGPAGFDCSGYMSGITNVLRGGSGYGTRYGTTATFPWSGFTPGYGAFTIGNSKRAGHMGGTLGGIGVESTDSSVRMGSAARGAGNPLFNERYHMAGADVSIKAIKGVRALMAKVGGWLKTMRKMGGWGPMLTGTVSSVMGGVKKFVDKAAGGAKSGFGNTPIGRLIDSIRDSGGIVRSGQFGLNLSGRPERMLSPKQTEQFERLVRGRTYGTRSGLDGGSGRFAFTITNWETGEGYFREIADHAIDDADAFAAGRSSAGAGGYRR